MADLKNTKGGSAGSSLAPPPPPPPPPLHSIPPAVREVSNVKPSSPITNGDSHNRGVTGKPRPPAKPFKLTRAFSTGSMTLGRLGKKNTKKNSLQENGIGMNGEQTPDLTRNDDENDSSAPRKLPGIGSKPILRKVSFKKSQPQTIQESPTAERQLPPLPDPNDGSNLPQRELPPIPNDISGISPVNRANMRDLPPLPEPDGSLTDSSTTRELPPIPNEEPEVLLPQNASSLIAPTNSDSPAVESSVTKVVKKNSFSKPRNNMTTAKSVPEETVQSEEGVSKSGSSDKKEAQVGETIDAKHTPPHSKSYDNGLANGELKHEVIHFEGNNVPEVTQNLERCDTNDDADVVSECSLSSMEDSPDVMHRSIASLTQHNSSIASDEPVEATGEVAPQDEAEDDYKDFYTIGEIVDSYSYAVPVSMRILQGYCSDTTDVNISTDDVYLLHSIKHSNMVTIRDEDSMTHKIPVNSPVKVGLIYNPKSNYEESLNGYEFKMVADMLAMPSLPKLIWAKQAIITGEDKSSVSEGEILVVGNTNKSMFKAKRGLKAYSLLTRSKKLILDSSIGCFSTKPSLVRIELATFMELIPDIIPAQVVMYPDSVDSASSCLEFLGSQSRVATILGSKTETALVVSDVSTLTEEEAREADLQPIPTESPASFNLLLDEDIAALEVIVQRWTYPEENEEEAAEEEKEEEEAVEGGVEHFYDDTVALFSDEQAEGQDGEVVKPPSVPTTPEKRKSESSVENHMYVNVQKEVQTSKATAMAPIAPPLASTAPSLPPTAPPLASTVPPLPPTAPPLAPTVATPALMATAIAPVVDVISEKEKQFFAEDEDAGYDTVGLHLIGKGSPVSPRNKDSIASSPLPPVDPGYSTVGSTVLTPSLPKVHDYSKIGPKTNKPSKKKPSTGYSTVQPHSTVNGVVIEDTGTTSEKISSLTNLDQKEMTSGSTEAKIKLEVESKTSNESSEMSRMQMMLEMLTKKMESVDSQLGSLASPPGVTATVAKEESPQLLKKEEEKKTESKSEKVSSESENLEFLQSLEVEQVGDLVSAMGLDQYVDKFLTEQISGEILMECDDDVLKDEIGITSKIHRIRLLKVINGQHSARGILEKKKAT